MYFIQFKNIKLRGRKMKIFYKIMSFVTVFFFTLNCACFAEESPNFSQDNKISLSEQNNKDILKNSNVKVLDKSYSKALKNNETKEKTQKFNFNLLNEKIIYILKSFGIPFLKHILSAIIDYTVASTIGNLIEIKIKNKNNPHDTFWLLRDPCCQC